MLSDSEKKRFFDDGFVGPFKIYEPEEAKEILRRIRRKNFDKTKAVFANDVNYDRHLDISELADHVMNPKIVNRLVDLLGPDLLCWRTEFFPKFPKSNGTEWHQVATYQYANGTPMLEAPEGDEHVTDLTVWTAFTDTTIKTACMRFLPGTHTAKYYDESKPMRGKSSESYTSIAAETDFYGYDFSELKIDPNWLPEEQVSVDVEMKAGECIIFTARCVHASHPNLSDTFTRFAISARYVPTRVKVYPETERFYAHGAWFDLKEYGCVLVAGKDTYHHNKIKKKDLALSTRAESPY